MITIKEMADAEADAVEAELGTDEELPADDETAEEETEAAAPAAPPSHGPGSKNFDRDLDREDKRHHDALARLFGEAWIDFNTCPLCQVAGYAQVYPPGEVPIEQRMAVMHVLGEPDAREFEFAPDYEAAICPICKGHGQLKTRSLAPGRETKECSACSAKGWLDNTEQSQLQSRLQAFTPPAAAPAPVWQSGPPAPAPTAAAPNGWQPTPGLNGNDSFGRWPGHERYGIDPATNGGLW